MGFPRMRLHKPQSSDISVYTQHFQQGQDNPLEDKGQAYEHHKLYFVIAKEAMKPAAFQSLYEEEQGVIQ